MAEFEILDILDQKGIDYEHKGGEEYAIVCPRQSLHSGGVDNLPSFSINIAKGKGHCFACNFSLDEVGLFRWLKGEELDDFQLAGMKIRSSLKRIKEKETTELVTENADFFFPRGEPWNEDYRGIKAETYMELGAIHSKRGRYQNRICLPIYVNNELIGVDARWLGSSEDKVAKYLRNKDSLCKTSWLFPYDKVKAMKPRLVVLAEGLFHSINSYDKDVAGLNFFGVQNWSANKLMMLLAIDTLEEVCFAPDPDLAGLKCLQRICACLKPWFKVSMVDMSEYWGTKTDWGDLSKEEMERLIENRLTPNIPTCLLEEGWEDTKIEYGKACKRRKCGFFKWGKCGNELYREQG